MCADVFFSNPNQKGTDWKLPLHHLPTCHRSFTHTSCQQKAPSWVAQFGYSGPILPGEAQWPHPETHRSPRSDPLDSGPCRPRRWRAGGERGVGRERAAALLRPHLTHLPGAHCMCFQRKVTPGPKSQVSVFQSSDLGWVTFLLSASHRASSSENLWTAQSKGLRYFNTVLRPSPSSLEGQAASFRTVSSMFFLTLQIWLGHAHF